MNKNDMRSGQGKSDPSRERPTLKTIAYMTGLGVTTVSRALKDAPDIAEHTKERVRLVAKQLGYMPNRAGVRLRTGKTNVIALVLSMEEEIMGMSGQMIFGISDILAPTPYHLVVMPQPIQSDPMVPIRYILDTGSADGVIISRIAPNDARVRLLLDRGMPFAAHGRMEDDTAFPYHDFDNEAYAYEAVEKLVQRGRRQIAALQPPAHLTYYRHFRSGFERGLRDFNATEVPLTATNTDAPLAPIRAAVSRLLTSPSPPDGIISCSSSGAIPVMTAINATGHRLGRDIDLVAKQPADLLNWISPEIITMSEDFRHAGRELARAVLDRLEGESPENLQNISSPVWTDPAPDTFGAIAK